MELTTAIVILSLAVLSLTALILLDESVRFVAKIGLICSALFVSAYYVVEAAKVLFAHIAG